LEPQAKYCSQKATKGYINIFKNDEKWPPSEVKLSRVVSSRHDVVIVGRRLLSAIAEASVVVIEVVVSSGVAGSWFGIWVIVVICLMFRVNIRNCGWRTSVRGPEIVFKSILHDGICIDCITKDLLVMDVRIIIILFSINIYICDWLICFFFSDWLVIDWTLNRKVCSEASNAKTVSSTSTAFKNSKALLKKRY
jgi:hypothetical protein